MIEARCHPVKAPIDARASAAGPDASAASPDDGVIASLADERGTLTVHVGHFLTRAAQRWPDRAAWLEGDVVVTFREAEARANRLAHALLALGARPGDRIGMLVPNCHQGLETILAPMKAGMGVVPMNIRLHPGEHEYMLNDSVARIVVYHEDFGPQLATIRTNLESVERCVAIGRGEEGDASFEEIQEGRPETPPDVAIQPDDLAWLFYTSGTTGRPKGAMLTHRNLIAMVQLFLLDLNAVRETDVLLDAAAIARGAASVFPATRSFEPRRIFEAIQRYRVTTMFLAPTMIHMLTTSGAHGNGGSTA
jgi:acyl-CoA synthetase (AMP-forming)/AMP-acid ligase II